MKRYIVFSCFLVLIYDIVFLLLFDVIWERFPFLKTYPNASWEAWLNIISGPYLIFGGIYCLLKLKKYQKFSGIVMMALGIYTIYLIVVDLEHL